LVRIPENASPSVIAQRKARADEVMRQLRTGADFAKMAATYSDAADALQGGVIGWRPIRPPAAAVRRSAGQAEAGPGHAGHQERWAASTS
jgi:peptidyl-prolyl cis-trans isomerase SurA